MKMLYNSVFLLMSFCFFSCKIIAQQKKENTTPPAPLYPLPTDAQMAWHEMETNAFIHFTTNTFTNLEWGFGNEPESIFNPTDLNVDQWAQVLHDAGFKMMILTCKHHDGFCLWPSAYTSHSIKNSPYKNGTGDIVKEASDAAKKYGLTFGIYLSPWDRNHADYGTSDYITYYRNQLKELFSNYGTITEMWLDGANGGNGFYGGKNETRKINGATYYDWPGTIQMIQTLAPQVLFFSDAGPSLRWIGNENGSAGETNWNMISPDTLYAGKAGIEGILNTGAENGTAWIPGECDVSIRPGWFYHAAENEQVKSPEKLFEIYLSSVGRGSTLLLNIPPDTRGLLHENDIAALQQFRKLLQKEFDNNLAKNALATASNYRGGMAAFSATQINDNNKETYWATNDNITAGSVQMQLPQVMLIKYVVLQEYIRLGQRVKSFTIEAWIDGKWQQVAAATTIGYKRILKLEPVFTDKIKLTINSSRACPLISNMELY